jgi:hypothetical protein
MKTLPTVLAASFAVALLGASSAYADHMVRRIDHPNGPPTFIPVPHERARATIGVYAGERSFATRQTEVRRWARQRDSEGRTLVPLHRGRGEVISVPVER